MVWLRGRASAWSALALTITLWASAFAGIRAGLKSFTVGELALLRLAIASLALVALAPAMRVRLPRRPDIGRVLAAGAIGMAAYQLLLGAGERTVSAGTASLLVNTGPIFVALLATRFLGERVTRPGWAGIGVGFIGALIISLGQGLSLAAGGLLVLAAAVCQASFFVVQKPLIGRYGSFAVTTYATVAATLMLLPFSISLPGAISRASGQAIDAALFLGIGASAMGFFAWAYASSVLEVSRAAPFLYLVPGVAIVVAWLWLGEIPRPASLIGGVIALTGVVLTNISRQSAPRNPAATATKDLCFPQAAREAGQSEDARN
jgi:drug/metabolite transporter (DMT)-like permease